MQISERVDKVLGELLGPGVAWDRETLLRDRDGLALDPLDIVELAMEIEDEFQIDWPDFEEDRTLETVGDVVDALERRLATKRALFA